VIDELHPAKVILSGGEPFLHPGIASIIDAVKDRKARLAVNTCGVFNERSIPPNFSKIDELYISWLGDNIDIPRYIPPLSFYHPMQLVIAALRSGIHDVWFNTVVIDPRQITSIPRACFEMYTPVHVMRLVNHGRATGMKVLSIAQQRAIAIAIIDQLDPEKASRRAPAFLCRHVEEVLPEDIARLREIHPSCKISHSLVPGECRSAEKRTMLPDGRLIGCVAGKGRDDAIGKRRACD
jgi:molybdenum cofactor biosynthesis enzyme MoaA